MRRGTIEPVVLRLGEPCPGHDTEVTATREGTGTVVCFSRSFVDALRVPPEGLRDVTGAFRLYQKEMERYERVAQGDRPLWLVEIDRFWKIQQGGGDPITQWLTMPMMYFEPPVSAELPVSLLASAQASICTLAVALREPKRTVTVTVPLTIREGALVASCAV